jgi:hypothetical protein
MGILYEKQCTFFILSQFSLEWEYFREKLRENQNTHFMFSIPPPKKSATCEIVGKNMGKNMVQAADMPQ